MYIKQACHVRMFDAQLGSCAIVVPRPYFCLTSVLDH